MALPKKADAKLPLGTAQLRPFLAPLLLARASKPSAASSLEELSKAVAEAVKSSDKVDRSAPKPTPVEAVGAMLIKTLQYIEASTPAWAPRNELQDIIHHLVVVAVQGDYAAVCASDPAVRARLQKAFKGANAPAQLLARTLVEQAFVGDRASVIWLNGIHSPVDAKPNAKTLSGSALEYALDPLGDQSFFYSAVRSRVSMAGGRAVHVGAAPAFSRVWVNRPKSWAEFTRDLAFVFDTLAKPAVAQVKFAALAQSVSDLKGVSDAYAVTLLSPDLIEHHDLTDEEREIAERWAQKAEFDVHPSAGASLEADVMLDGVGLGRVVLTVWLDGEAIVVEPVWNPAPAVDQALRDEGSRLLSDPKWLKVYYESGHTVSKGRCYASAYRDQRFAWIFKDFSSHEVKDEKPKPYGKFKLPDVIAAVKEDGKTMDNSLFAYVVAEYGKSGWLACDDGSGELADFIHIADDHTVSLIHVKGSKSKKLNRSVSVSNYEVVVGQAVKNLRHLQGKTLYDELKRGKDKQIATAVWRDGNRIGNRNGIIARAKRLPSNHQRVVVVLQPQLTETEHKACLDPKATRARSIRMKQLDTLMLSARLSCMAVGSDFVGVAAE